MTAEELHEAYQATITVLQAAQAWVEARMAEWEAAR